MTGGYWDYFQNHLPNVIKSIQVKIGKNGRKKTNDELKLEYWNTPEWYKKFPQDLLHYKYPDEVVEEFRNAVKAIKIAHVYIQRLDWLFSGDDNEQDFLKKLHKELKKL